MLLTLSVAPVLIGLFYIYIRDKYEKEPFYLLFTGVFFGVLISVPIVMTENLLTSFMPNLAFIGEAMYISFVVAALAEEGFKYAVLYFLTWKNRNLNEKYDGIVYSVFIALGFAGLENILYVFNSQFGGLSTAVGRGIFSVPAHGFFGVCMGYYFTLARFEPEHRNAYFVKGFIIPLLLHGTYDFILLSGAQFVMPVFIIFSGYLWIQGMGKIKKHVESSPFKI